MILQLFTIYDKAAEAFLLPFFLRSAGEAIRAFTEAVNDPKTNFYNHPHDYTLFVVGEFNQDDGVLIPQTPTALGNGLQYCRHESGRQLDLLKDGDPDSEGAHA